MGMIPHEQETPCLLLGIIPIMGMILEITMNFLKCTRIIPIMGMILVSIIYLWVSVSIIPIMGMILGKTPNNTTCHSYNPYYGDDSTATSQFLR